MKRFKGLGKIRDSVAEKSKATASDTARRMGEAAKSALDTSVERTQAAASEAGRRTVAVSKETLEAAVEQTRTVSRDAVNKVYTECPVNMFMLPTGPNPGDYALIFRFDQMPDNLNSGALVRPKLEILSGRTDGYDTEHLQQEIKQEFALQFEAAREPIVRAIAQATEAQELKGEVRRLDLERDIARRFLDTVLTWANRAAITIILLPIALILWLVAMRCWWEYRKTRQRTESRQAEISRRLASLGEFDKRELERSLKELESKNRVFQQATENIALREHPRIRNLAAMISELELVPFEPGDTEHDHSGIPDSQVPFHHPAYLKQLPEVYQPFLNAV